MIVCQQSVCSPVVPEKVILVNKKTELQQQGLESFACKLIFELLGQVCFELFVLFSFLENFLPQLCIVSESCPEITVNLRLEQQTQERTHCAQQSQRYDCGTGVICDVSTVSVKGDQTENQVLEVEQD